MALVSPATWHAANVFRPPHWRWCRTQFLVENKLSPEAGIDGAWVGRALQFLADGTSNSANKSNKLPTSRRRAIEQARDIHVCKDRLRRDRIAAWLLTSAPLDRVAAACSLPLPVVTAFAELFFDVRPGLTASDWILLYAVGRGLGANFAGASLGTIWKYFGYVGGELVLATVIAATTNAPLPPEMMSTFTNPAIDERVFRAKVRLLIASMMAETAAQRLHFDTLYDRLRQHHSRPTNRGDESPMLALQADFLSRLGGKPRRSPKKVAANKKTALSALDAVRAMQRIKPIAAASSVWG